MKGLLINATALKAVAFAAADDGDIRYYLRAVYVEWTPKDYRLTATDGKMQLCYREEFEEADESRGTGSVIVPIGAVRRVKVHRNVIDVVFSEYMAGENRLVEFGAPMAQPVIAEAIDASFPDYRRVIPAKCDGKVAQYDTALMYRFHKAASLLSKSPYVTLAHNGPGPALVGIGDRDYIGIIMPFRGDVPECPEWAKPYRKIGKDQPAIVQPERAAA